LLVAGGRECALELEEMRTFFLMRALFFAHVRAHLVVGLEERKVIAVARSN
jgi:hypothetical protein